MHIVGIDPGLSSALAVLAPDGMLEAFCDTMKDEEKQ
jgi:predicted RNase H-like nuclease (RuvC/YqgF family)